MLFEDLKISAPIMRALALEGYEAPTPIQVQAIPPSLEGKDILGCAQTGTGKTAAFAIPILQGLTPEDKNPRRNRSIQALILAPTRELAIQIGDSFTSYGRYLDLKTLVIYGGVSQNPQTKALESGTDILVATPGRLLDLINQKYVRLHQVKYFVLDEADQMLDMGMLQDVKKIIKFIPAVRQTMFFSATMPPEIAKLADQLLVKPVKVQVTPVSSTVEIINQTVYHVNKSNKLRLLADLLENPEIESALVFSRTKHGADKISKALIKEGIQAQAIHGNKSQNARQLALNNFKERKTRILVATDIAARGLDIDELSHVVNFDLPEVPETYVHRIGRTGRAGMGGSAIAFCDPAELHLLKDIQKLTGKVIPVVEDHPFPVTEEETLAEQAKVASKPSPGPKPVRKNPGRRRTDSGRKK